MTKAYVRTFTATMKCITGLRIGGGDGPLAIGTIDNPIIRDPVTREPYIPGSSLKGKMRSSLERACNGKTEFPCGCGKNECPICVMFGPHYKKDHQLGPSRFLFRDAYFTKEQREKAQQQLAQTGQELIEIKNENIINRVNNVAQHPRQVERIIPGTEFAVEIGIIVLEGDNEEWFKRTLAEGLKWIEDTYLGGSGSRGYGKVRFTDWKLDGQPWDGKS